MGRCTPLTCASSRTRAPTPPTASPSAPSADCAACPPIVALTCGCTPTSSIPTSPCPAPSAAMARRGLGVAVCMHGTAIAGLDMGAASLKMNDDGSFNMLVGATDIGTGSDTALAQIAAETLGCPLSDILAYSSDTDLTPFDTGAYASSTTFISGGAVMKAAEKVREQIFERVALILGGEDPARRPSLDGMYLRNRRAWLPDGRSVSLEQVALHSLHTMDQQQIMATASHM